MIPITKTYLPDKKKYLSYVDRIFESGWITNNGTLVRELEERLCDYLDVPHLVLTANGTIALEIAYRLLKLRRRAITTPFSFVATTASMVSNGISPVFVDIDPKSFCIDASRIEAAIDAETEAIVPVHLFGNACDVEAIEKIAERHRLKVVYDAAHAFGVRYKEKSLLRYGDIATLSFHATKLFHTIEGGALVVNDPALVEEARFMINFGIDGPDSVKALGTNAKMNEFEAAMGLCMLEELPFILEKRAEVWYRYEKALAESVVLPRFRREATRNYAFFPIVLKDEAQMFRVKEALARKEVYVRRYFNPPLDRLPYMQEDKSLYHTHDIASRILGLPIYPTLQRHEQTMIIRTVLDALQEGRG